MSYKIINKVDPILYLALSVVGFIVPEQVYKLFLLNPDAVLSSTEATLARANGVGVTFAALLIAALSSYMRIRSFLHTVTNRLPSHSHLQSTQSLSCQSHLLPLQACTNREL